MVVAGGQGSCASVRCNWVGVGAVERSHGGVRVGIEVEGRDWMRAVAYEMPDGGWCRPRAW